MRTLSRTACAIVVLAALTGQAAAQGNPNWSGPYAGIALGARWADTTWTTTGLQIGRGPVPIDASSPSDFNLLAFRSGGYAGYNWQNRGWVYGFELGIGYANDKQTHAGLPGCSIMCDGLTPGPAADLASVRMGWDASARTRLGYLVMPDLLLYGTGGLAWQQMKTSATCQHSGADPFCVFAPGNPFDTQTSSRTLTGWTVGGGLERMIGANWLIRADYQFSHFDKWDWNNTFKFVAPAAPATEASIYRYLLGVDTHVATIGLAYKFGGPREQPLK
jgi:outer membrane immunogenic protein